MDEEAEETDDPMIGSKGPERPNADEQSYVAGARLSRHMARLTKGSHFRVFATRSGLYPSRSLCR